MATASRKPPVVSSAVPTPLRSIRALVTRVVPWTIVLAAPAAEQPEQAPPTTAPDGPSWLARVLPTDRLVVDQDEVRQRPPMSLPTR